MPSPQGPSGAGNAKGCCPFDRIAPLSDERDAITERLRAFNREQVAVGGVALWVSQDGSLGKSFYRAKAEAEPKADHEGLAPLCSNSLLADPALALAEQPCGPVASWRAQLPDGA